MTIQDSVFHPPQFPPGRSLDTVIALDFDGHGGTEYVVTSRDTGASQIPGARADLIQTFSYDSATHAYRAVLIDTIFGAHSIHLRDLTGDGVPEVIVDVNSGGNDPIATLGMAVYSGHGGTIRPIFEAREGQPELTTMRGIPGPVIVLHDLYWPQFAPHVAARPYTSDLLTYREGKFVSVRSEQPRYFLDQADRYLREYRHQRDSVMRDTAAFDSSGDEVWAFDLLSPAALAIRSFQLADAQAQLRSFWSSEHDFLQRRLPDAYYDDLAALYAGKTSHGGTPPEEKAPALP